MAKHTDELVTQFEQKGAKTFQGDVAKNASAAERFAKRHEKMLETLGFLGPKIEAVGDKLLGFARNTVEAGKYSQDVDRDLQSMFEVKGYSQEAIQDVKNLGAEIQDLGGISDEEVKRAATLMASYAMTPKEITSLMPALVSQARLVGSSTESVAMAIGKAFGSGQWGLLSRYGITLDEVARAELRRAQKMAASGDASLAAESRAIGYNIVLKALAENVPKLSDRMKTAVGVHERMEQTMGDLREEIGAGVRDAQMWGDNIIYHMIRPMVGSHTEGMKMVGWLTYLGGGLLKTGGFLASNYGQWLQYANSMKIARVLTAAQTGAQNAQTASAVAGAKANTILGMSYGTAALAGLGLAAVIALIIDAMATYNASKEAKEQEKAADDFQAQREKWMAAHGGEKMKKILRERHGEKDFARMAAEGRFMEKPGGAATSYGHSGEGITEKVERMYTNMTQPVATQGAAPGLQAGTATMNTRGDVNINMPGLGGTTPARLDEYSLLAGAGA